MTTSISVDSLRRGDRRSLAKCLTLVESTRADDRAESIQLIESILPHTGNSIRIGISGVPGVGKSTFIEAFGLLLIEQGKKVAVLAVDPSSPIAGGSILGDKTRMVGLSRHDRAFIRPTPSSGVVGGIASKTRESILLCEAAGYDIVLVETVGVGQSEVEVDSMVDFFMLLMVPNAGDELQGIKRGITELVDAIVINKADGESLSLANKAKQYYLGALKLMSKKHDFWEARVIACSSIELTNLSELWSLVKEFEAASIASNQFHAIREAQNLAWLNKLIHSEIEARLDNNSEIQKVYPRLEQQVVAGQISPQVAAAKILKLLFSEF